MIFKKYNFSTLDGFLAFIRKMLNTGVKNYKHPFHCPVLVTGTGNLGEPRTVILRHFSEKERSLICHSDVRAPKIQQIRKNPHVAWLFYDPKSRLQLRIYGKATIHTDDALAQDLWKRIRVTNRMNYCTTLTPGTPLDKPSSGLPDFVAKTAPPLLDKNTGRENFAAICCHFNTIDALLLGLTGHRRAKFAWGKDQVTSTWIVP